MASNLALMKSKAFINGEWVENGSNDTFPVYNPFNNELIMNVVDCDLLMVESAIQSANKAFEIWKSFSVKKRSRIMLNWYNLILEHQRELAEILCLEMGKPILEATGEIKYGANYIQWFAEEAKRINGDIIPSLTSDKRSMVIRQPIGVVGAITPWNFPSAMITRKVAPALAAGCTVVIKPSEETPLSALALAELSIKAGFPPGVINVIPSNNPQPIGQLFCKSPLIRKLSFTGSTKVGKKLLAQCAEGIKKVSLELGGNAPFIVFEDANLDMAIDGLMDAKFRNAGQTCICANRIFVHKKIKKEFIQKLIKRVADLKLGSGMDRSVHIGPLINEKAKTKVNALITSAQAAGAICIHGEQRQDDSLFFDPCILDNVQPGMQIAQEEIFGPVIALITFNSDDELIEMANDTSFGLASYFYSTSISRCFRISEALAYGMVGVNTGIISSEFAPFGGVKESGIGREGSKYGIDDYLEMKYICFGGI